MRTFLAFCFLIGALASLSACSSYRDEANDSSKAEVLGSRSLATIEEFRRKDPTIQKFFDSAYGYAVLPRIAKGAAGIGAADGDGVVYEQGKLVGLTGMTQVTVGFQLGGQSYSELIFFQDKTRLDRFKAGNMEFSANASAVAVESGAAASNDFKEGLAVFTMPIGGLMFEASVGGQKFTYRSLP